MTGFSTDTSRATGNKPMPLDSQAPKEMELTQLGRYRLCFELASGGMATVYLARMEGPHGFEKIVALKQIHPHLVSERAYVDMFLDEARIASGITHPNVCSVFDFGESNGKYYLAMEYLVGEPLGRLFGRVAANPEQRSSPLHALRCARIIEEACEGLHAAHESTDADHRPLNVVHRDVSPKNLFMTYSGVVQVVDFGIASARQRVHRTSTGQLKGTMPYMAPEQISGGQVDRRLDIWGLGVVLWELLTLDRLFRRETEAETMFAVLVNDIPRPSERRPDVPPELDAIVMKALERDPEKRWPTTRAMGKALHAFAAKQSNVVGAAELSEWMRELFPLGEARKREVMELARTDTFRMDAAPAHRTADLSEAPTMMGDFDVPTQVDSRPKSKRALVAILSAALIVSATALWGFQELATRPEQHAVEPEASVIEPAASAPEAKPENDAPSQGEQAADEPTTAEAPEPLPAEAEPTKIEPTATDQVQTKQTQAKASAHAKRRTAARRPRPRKKASTPTQAQPVTSGLPGQVKVITKGHAVQIYEGGKLLGTTPTVLKLPAGIHRLRLKSSETGESMTLPVNVVANATKTISLDVE